MTQAGQAWHGTARQGTARWGQARQAWRVVSWLGTDWQGSAGTARPGWVCLGEARHGKAGMASRVSARKRRVRLGTAGMAGQGLPWCGKARQARRRKACLVSAGQGSAGAAGGREASCGVARRGLARQAGQAWLGPVGPGAARRCMAGQARLGTARCGASWSGKAGGARRCTARHVEAWCGRHVQARQGVARLGTASQGPAGQARHVVFRHVVVMRGMARQAWLGSSSSTATAGEKQTAPLQLGGTTGAVHPTRRVPMSENITPSLVIDQIAAETLSVPIVGTSPLIVHNFSEKSKRQMLDNMQGRKSVKQAKDPQAEYEAAFYRIANEEGPEKYGFPVIAFKAATIGAARFYDKSVTMRSLMQAVFMRGVLTKADAQQLVEIEGEPRMREDVVRVGVSGTDLRYRPEFTTWSASLTVTYVKSMLSRNSLISLIDAGGMGVGVGEWRPEKSGDFGTYAVDQSRKVEVIS